MTEGETIADGPKLLVHPSLGEVRADILITFNCECGAAVFVSHADAQVQCSCGVIFVLGWDIRLMVLRPVPGTATPLTKIAAAA